MFICGKTFHRISKSIPQRCNKLHLYENPDSSGYYYENIVELKQFEIDTIYRTVIR